MTVRNELTWGIVWDGQCIWRLCQKIYWKSTANPWYQKKDILIGNVPPKKSVVWHKRNDDDNDLSYRHGTRLDWPNLAAHMCSRRIRVLGGSKSLWTAFIFMTTCQYSLVVLTMDALSLIHFRKRVLHCLLKKMRVIVPISVSDSVWMIVGLLVLNQSGC